MKKKILIMGLPGSGKSTLAHAMLDVLDTVVYWNADEVRANINSHLTFSSEDRIKQAKTMKWLSDKVVESGNLCIVDFICPTPETRQAFNTDDAFVVWVDRIKEGRFDDTNKLFVPPEDYDFRVTEESGIPEKVAGEIVQILFGG
jgi:adenylylsulfate kinase-like enzyme